MKVLSVQIPEESVAFVTSLLEKLGAKVEEKEIAPDKKKKDLEVSPTFLFGKWKNIDLDAKELRQKSWDRSHKF
jgi:hypothetical protein